MENDNMNNITYEVVGTKLVCTIDISPKALKAAQLSSTGKTRLVANTRFPEKVAGKVAGLKFSMTVMAPP